MLFWLMNIQKYTNSLQYLQVLVMVKSYRCMNFNKFRFAWFFILR